MADDAPHAFEKWWQALPLRNGEITADHIRQAWDAGVKFERGACQRIAAQYGGSDADEIAEAIGVRNFA